MAEDVSGNGDSGSHGDKFGFLTRKVGPLPIWVYGVIIIGAYYWYTHYGPGAQKQQSGQQTPVATEKVVRSGGPTLTTIHQSHQRPQHSRKGSNGNN